MINFFKIYKVKILSFFLLFPVMYFFILGLYTGIFFHSRDYFVYHDKQKVEFFKKKPIQWLSLNEISQQAIWPIIISEDWNFFLHHGIDVHQLKIVILDFWSSGEFKRGASTITQQVIKNLYLSSNRSFLRKINEIILAIYFDAFHDKKWILEIYFNLIELDKNIYGLKKGSQHYFNKPAAQLNFREGAFLAVMLPNPKSYSQSFRNKELTDYVSSQMNHILDKLVLAKIITDDQKNKIIQSQFSWEKSNDFFSLENLLNALGIDRQQ